jgi:hypothetical protein
VSVKAEPSRVHRLVCDLRSGNGYVCMRSTPRMISQEEAQRIGRELGWRVGQAGDDPVFDYCPEHKDRPAPRPRSEPPPTPSAPGDPDAF